MQEVIIRDIVFSSGATGDEDLYCMDIFGRNVRRLTYSTRVGETNRTPEWSPDGLQIAFQSNRDGPREIYILTTATGEVKRISRSGRDSNHPAWSPDGKEIIYVSDGGIDSFFTIVDTDSLIERLLIVQVFAGRSLLNPCWTPDGSKIAFVLKGRERELDSLWNVDLDGRNPVLVGPEGISVFEYDYSSDGDCIVFDAKVSNDSFLGEWDIFTMRADGSEIRRLTESKAMSSRPKWLSDSNTIVFHSNRFGDRFPQPGANAPLEEWFSWWNQFEICLISKSGGAVTRLTENQYRDLHPDG